MSEARVFDTHKSFKRLTEAGADEKLAEAIIDCQSSSQSELATKADIIWVKWAMGGLLILNIATLSLVVQIFLSF